MELAVFGKGGGIVSACGIEDGTEVTDVVGFAIGMELSAPTSFALTVMDAFESGLIGAIKAAISGVLRLCARAKI